MPLGKRTQGFARDELPRTLPPEREAMQRERCRAVPSILRTPTRRGQSISTNLSTYTGALRGGLLLLECLHVKVDGIYSGPRTAQAATDHGANVQAADRERDETGFRPLPLRWRIEATFGTLANRWRRLARNPEQSPTAADDAVNIANCHRLRAYHRPEHFAT